LKKGRTIEFFVLLLIYLQFLAKVWGLERQAEENSTMLNLKVEILTRICAEAQGIDIASIEKDIEEAIKQKNEQNIEE